MRVLYAINFPAALSESYVRAELEWMQRQGVDVCIVAHETHTAPYPNTVEPDKILVGKSITAAIHAFKPDIVHAHWLVMLQRKHMPFLSGVRVPITIRGHAFDALPDNMASMANVKAVKRIWLFPHFMNDYPHPKMSALPVGYDPLTMPAPASPPRGPRRVLRTMAGLPQKRIENMLEIARLCPDVPFTLIMTSTPPPDDYYPPKIKDEAPPNVEVLFDLQREEVLAQLHRSSIYLMTPPDHRFGMPISIAEAMGSGLWPLVPNLPGIKDYVGDAGSVYDSVEDAAWRIRNAAFSWDEGVWSVMRLKSLAQAEQFHADRVFSVILNEWRALLQPTAGFA